MTERKAKKRTSRIPVFASRQEEATWFDSHDMGKYQDEFKTIKVRFAKNLSEGITVRLDPKTLAQLRARANEQGIGPTTLARMWILDHLREQKRRSRNIL